MEASARQKRYIFWDWERARTCILDDYLGSHPFFGPDDFKRISVDAKILISLKYLAYVTAWRIHLYAVCEEIY
jgi:hypothetical protein